MSTPPNLVLRPYQSGAIQGIYNYFHAASGNPLVVIPDRWRQVAGHGHLRRGGAQGAYPDQRILIVTHVRELIEQNYCELVPARGAGGHLLSRPQAAQHQRPYPLCRHPVDPQTGLRRSTV